MKRLLNSLLALVLVAASMVVAPMPTMAAPSDSIESTCQRVSGNWCLKYTYYGETQDEGTDIESWPVAGGQCQLMPDGSYKKQVAYYGHDWRIYAVYGHWEHLILPNETMETYEGSSDKVYYGDPYEIGREWIPC